MFDFLPQYAVHNSIQQFQFHYGFFVWIQILRVHIWPSQDTMMFSLFLYFVNEVIMFISHDVHLNYCEEHFILCWYYHDAIVFPMACNHNSRCVGTKKKWNSQEQREKMEDAGKWRKEKKTNHKGNKPKTERKELNGQIIWTQIFSQILVCLLLLFWNRLFFMYLSHLYYWPFFFPPPPPPPPFSFLFHSFSLS